MGEGPPAEDPCRAGVHRVDAFPEATASSVPTSSAAAARGGRRSRAGDPLNQTRRCGWAHGTLSGVCKEEAAMWTWVGVMILTAATAAGFLGCSQQPSGTAAVIEDRTYTVTPAAMKVKAGIVTGDVTEMKVTERVEKGSGRVISPAKLTAKVVLKNSSANQTVRLGIRTTNTRILWRGSSSLTESLRSSRGVNLEGFSFGEALRDAPHNLPARSVRIADEARKHLGYGVGALLGGIAGGRQNVVRVRRITS
jgi:hypothetical protein